MSGEHRHGPPRPITIGEAFEKLGDYFTEQHGPGSADDGWARLQRALDAEEPTNQTAEPAPDRWERLPGLVDEVRAWWDRIAVKYSIASVLMVIGLANSSADGATGVVAAAVGIPSAAVVALSALLQSARRQEAEAKAAKVLQEHRREMRLQIARRNTARRQAAARNLMIQTLGRTDSAGIIHLSSVDLRDQNLTELNLIGAALEDATLDGMNLRSANLYGANLTGASMFGTELARADLCGATLARADLTSAQLIGARLSGAVLTRANLAGANLSGADLLNADLSGADLSGAILSGADLSGADLSGANLPNAYLTGASLQGVNLEGANLSRASLRGSYLHRANLTRADLTGADISTTILKHTTLIGATLAGARLLDLADLEEVTWSEATLWGHYHDEVLRRSVPLGRGWYKLNPPEGTTLDGPIILPRLPV